MENSTDRTTDQTGETAGRTPAPAEHRVARTNPGTTAGSERSEPTRIPGVRYRKVTRHRPETVVIDGHPETRDAPYDTWVPVPPRDWDRVLRRGVVAVAIGATVLAAVAATAGIGGFLSTLLPAQVAYAVAVVFDCVWLTCTAIEWLERFDPRRARGARLAGWAALLISMSVVIAFGARHDMPAAGAAAASVSPTAKLLWWLVLRLYSVPLSDTTRFWLRRRQERVTATAALARQLQRLNHTEAYMHAVYGPTALRATDLENAAPPSTGHRPDTAHASAAESAAPPDEAAPPTPGHPLRTTPEPPTRPPAAAHSAAGQADFPGHSGAGDGGAPVVRVITMPSIAETVRTVLAHHPHASPSDLTARVAAVHGHRDGLAETVRRTRSRIEGNTKRRTSAPS
ncbi:hypothetical protein LO772_29485 [Yinghuangia sp. ASG 101]|uniref:hypothetical protein n=1 Tax=Yinghuangia sp. ASG 101 TaxID=2896848 RepID=UPI001E3D1A06|nr:hypothetical protein [Yinghuangia sp. ASG 101]UGQ10904.1 hypothetical protein LO772_29485 [Yinghuangia sp. ASG 101]